MTKSEILETINSTIDEIRESSNNVNDIDDANYVVEKVERWLDQLRNDISDYNNAGEDE